MSKVKEVTEEIVDVVEEAEDVVEVATVSEKTSVLTKIGGFVKKHKVAVGVAAGVVVGAVAKTIIGAKAADYDDFEDEVTESVEDTVDVTEF